MEKDGEECWPWVIESEKTRHQTKLVSRVFGVDSTMIMNQFFEQTQRREQIERLVLLTHSCFGDSFGQWKKKKRTKIPV